MKRWHILLIILAVIGLLDALYLTREHYQNLIPPCSVNPIFGDCGKVLRSQYSVVFGVPLALIGVIHYIILTTSLIVGVILKKRNARIIAYLFSVTGFISSLYFVYLQLVIVHAICIYCMVSALSSTFLFIISAFAFQEERRKIIIRTCSLLYEYAAKPIFFLIDPEIIHTHMVRTGETMGTIEPVKALSSTLLQYKHPSLSTHVAGIYFENPIGLAAGFDYEARLTQILPSIGFGFQTVGTITNRPYKGNPRPMLGRLPKSQSLMVNKGFKNLGAEKTILHLSHNSFGIPVGVSIGRTNTQKNMTQKQSVSDIIQAFIRFEKAGIDHSYYELNISCPNLYGDVSFYPPNNLRDLLQEVDKLQLTRPLFIKMPIEKNEKETLSMLDVIARHSPAGVIFGNLQKNRKHPLIHPEEVIRYPVGNFSGKPTFEQSNERIRLSYRHFHERLDIIGCGGVFNAQDAYEKIRLGASLVQLITGMIFKGPQLIADINMGLVELLQRDGFTDVAQAVGSGNKT